MRRRDFLKRFGIGVAAVPAAGAAIATAVVAEEPKPKREHTTFTPKQQVRINRMMSNHKKGMQARIKELEEKLEVQEDSDTFVEEITRKQVSEHPRFIGKRPHNYRNRYGNVNKLKFTSPAGKVNVLVGQCDFELIEEREFVYQLDRGLLDSVREGRPVTTDFNLLCKFEAICVEGDVAVGDWKAVINSIHGPSDDPCETPHFTIEAELDDGTVLTLPHCRRTSMTNNMDSATIELSGTAYAQATLSK